MTTNDMVLAAPTTPALADRLAQANRLLIAQSAAFTLLKDGEPDDEVREAVSEEVRGLVIPALAGVRAELAPAQSRDELTALMLEIAAYLRFGGGTMTDAARDEFIDGVLDELREYPLGLLAESVRRSRKRIRAPWEMVAWVVADIEPAVDRLKLEEERMAKLAEIAAA